MYFNRFDICEAWYLWLSMNHRGKGCPRYARLSRLLTCYNPPAYSVITPNGENENMLAILENLERNPPL